MKAPDKLGLSSVIVASNELCYHTNCSRWFSRSVTIERNPVTGQCVSEQKLFTLSRALYYNDSK